MSTEEQDAMLGRAVREYRECQRKVAALEAKVSESLDAITKELQEARDMESILKQRMDRL